MYFSNLWRSEKKLLIHVHVFMVTGTELPHEINVIIVWIVYHQSTSMGLYSWKFDRVGFVNPLSICYRL